MQVPKLDKIVLNMGVGEAVNDTKKVKTAADDLEKIAGQKPVITHARKSIADFKVREDMPLGVKVTLRKQRMYEFLDRLVNIALPRVRDFRGLNPNSLRRPWQLRHGHQGTHHFPGDQLRPDRSGLGHGHRSCAPRRRPTTKPVRCSRRSISPSGSKPREEEKDREMAKTSSIEKNNTPQAAMAKQFAAKRAALKAVTDEPVAAAGGALRAPAQAGRAAAQFVAKVRVRNRCEVSGPSARLLPQAAS